VSNISLIIGLGNPGTEYAQTRHNAGFWFVERLAEQYGITLKNDPKFHGISGRGQIEGQDIRLLLPTTFMNRSGQSVVPFSKAPRSEQELMDDAISHTLSKIKLLVNGEIQQAMNQINAYKPG